MKPETNMLWIGFSDFRSAREWRRQHGGWIFDEDQTVGNLTVWFPNTLLPSVILAHPVLRGIPGILYCQNPQMGYTNATSEGMPGYLFLEVAGGPTWTDGEMVWETLEALQAAFPGKIINDVDRYPDLKLRVKRIRAIYEGDNGPDPGEHFADGT